MRTISFGFLIAVYTTLTAGAEELFHPGGYNINSSYTLSSPEITEYDTLTITRTIVNGEDFELSSLYLAENLPDCFNIESHSLTIEGIPQEDFFSGPLPNQDIPGFVTFRWVIQTPTPDDPFDRVLFPGETLILEYHLTCSTVGSYVLPFHTACMYGDGTGLFTTSEEILINVEEYYPVKSTDPLPLIK